uniref:Uncharacterized protein n=2 Tax=Tanacetum cinerariifolium TaxID=118510 RepID=A0A699HYI4_TANCI|nr:hypothetical protein [Tanacetum cinerariifolium]
MNSPPKYEWEKLLDIDDSDLSLTLVLHPCNSYVRETTTTTQNPVAGNLKETPVRTIPGHAGIVQVSKLRKQSDIHEGWDESVLSIRKYIRKVVDDVCEDENFKGYSSGNGSGVGGSGMLDEEEIMKLLKEEEMSNFELQVCGNVIDQDDQYIEVACALEVEAVRALDLVKVEAVGALNLVKVEATCFVGALDLVGLSLNILFSASVSGYLTSLNKTRSSSSKHLHHWILEPLLQAL